jgi:hypothetical protein
MSSGIFSISASANRFAASNPFCTAKGEKIRETDERIYNFGGKKKKNANLFLFFPSMEELFEDFGALSRLGFLRFGISPKSRRNLPRGIV